MTLFRTKNEKPVDLDGGDGITNKEDAKVPDETAGIPRRSRKKLVLKVGIAAVVIVALALGVYAAVSSNTAPDPPSVVSSSAVYGDSALRQEIG